jgi:hypothetical protein
VSQTRMLCTWKNSEILIFRDGPLEKWWGAGWGKSKYKNRAGETPRSWKNNFVQLIIFRKIIDISKKKFVQVKKSTLAPPIPHPPPPITFLMVRHLVLLKSGQISLKIILKMQAVALLKRSGYNLFVVYELFEISYNINFFEIFLN